MNFPIQEAAEAEVEILEVEEVSEVIEAEALIKMKEEKNFREKVSIIDKMIVLNMISQKVKGTLIEVIEKVALEVEEIEIFKIEIILEAAEVILEEDVVTLGVAEATSEVAEAKEEIIMNKEMEIILPKDLQ